VAWFLEIFLLLFGGFSLLELEHSSQHASFNVSLFLNPSDFKTTGKNVFSSCFGSSYCGGQTVVDFCPTCVYNTLLLSANSTYECFGSHFYDDIHGTMDFADAVRSLIS
jgi:hypothetical protein